MSDKAQPAPYPTQQTPYQPPPPVQQQIVPAEHVPLRVDEPRSTYNEEEDDDDRSFTILGMEPKFILIAIVSGFLLLVVIITLGLSATTVDAGHVGVVKSFGAVKPMHLNAGLHWVTPFVDSVEQVNIQISEIQHTSYASSKDLQTVTTEVSVQYFLSADQAPEIYKQIGKKANVERTVLQPAMQESVKAVTAKYTAEELITKREAVKTQIRAQILEYMTTTLASDELANAINVANVAITDFKFSPEFNRAIEMKVRAEQEALQAKNEKIKRVTQAEAASQEKKIAADAMAYEIEKQATARALAIKKESLSLKNNPELIQLRLAEKWDGVLPVFTGGGNDMMLDVSSIMNRGRGNRAGGNRAGRSQIGHQQSDRQN